MIGDRWGVSPDEVARHFPCDDIEQAPALAVWRGTTVHAPAAHVWLWVRQIRLGPYAYDLVDNRGRRSPRQLHDLPEPSAGDAFTSVGGRPAGRILSVEPGVQITAQIMGALMSYVLVPADDSTRLLLKVVKASVPGIGAVLLSVGDLIMARRQLLNLKRLAERTAPPRDPSSCRR